MGTLFLLGFELFTLFLGGETLFLLKFPFGCEFGGRRRGGSGSGSGLFGTWSSFLSYWGGTLLLFGRLPYMD